MATKRVSWEVIEGAKYLYFKRRKRALAYAREAHKQGHPVEMQRWEWIGDGEPTHTQVDVHALIAEAKEREQAEEAEIQKALNTPLAPLPTSVWRDVAQALSWQMCSKFSNKPEKATAPTEQGSRKRKRRGN